jgi:hypothetical protein
MPSGKAHLHVPQPFLDFGCLRLVFLGHVTSEDGRGSCEVPLFDSLGLMAVKTTLVGFRMLAALEDEDGTVFSMKT